MAGIDSYTKLMLHMNGTDGSTTFTDDSTSAHAMTANGNAQIDTAQYKFGGASGLFDGTGDYVTTPNSTDFDFGTGDFTIDFWVRREATTAYAGIFSVGSFPSASDQYTIGFSYPSGTTILVRRQSGSSWANTLTGSTVLTLDTWAHVAVVRSGSTLYIFVNGGLDNSTTVSGAFDSNGVDCVIGRLYVNDDRLYVTAHIDELRVSKGIARWTSNFTPPTSEYTLPTDILPFIRTRNARPINKIPSDVLVW